MEYRERVRKYVTLMACRIPALIFAAVAYGIWHNGLISLLIIVVSVPLPWMAVLLANDRPPRRFEDRPQRAEREERAPRRAEQEAPRQAPQADESGLVRLSKRMSELGLCSRREADEWIPRGWVLVDGEPVTELGSRVKPDAIIEIHQAARSEQGERVTVLLHKPGGA